MKAIDVTNDNVQMSKSVAKVGPLLAGIGLASLGLSAGLGSSAGWTTFWKSYLVGWMAYVAYHVWLFRTHSVRHRRMTRARNPHSPQSSDEKWLAPRTLLRIRESAPSYLDRNQPIRELHSEHRIRPDYAVLQAWCRHFEHHR